MPQPSASYAACMPDLRERERPQIARWRSDALRGKGLCDRIQCQGNADPGDGVNRRLFGVALLFLLGSCTDETTELETEGDRSTPENRSLVPLLGETGDRAFIAAMRSDLSQVRTAQEIFYVDNDFVYANDVAELSGADLFSGTPGVRITINYADERTWDATATHPSTQVKCDFDSEVGTVDCI